jgi:hypothetical protein
MRGIIPTDRDISRVYLPCVIYGIRHHEGFAKSRAVEELCATSTDKIYARARNARLIMSNQVPTMSTDDVKPYCIWYPDVASKDTYRSLAKQYPDMVYTVGRACAVAGYDDLYHELNILPEVSIAEEARDNASKPGSKAIFDHIMSQPACYAILDDYAMVANLKNPRAPAFMNGDTAVRSLLDIRISVDKIKAWRPEYFDIVEDYFIAETSSELTHEDFQALEHVDMMYTPLPLHLPTVTKDPLILMAAYEGNLDRYIRLRRPILLKQEEKAIIRGIYHNTTFAKYWSLQDLSKYKRAREIRRATIARFIMVNDLSHITPTTPAKEDMPGLIWWPLIPDNVTLRELARRRPDMKLQVAMTCIASNNQLVWDELKPEPCLELWQIAEHQWMTNANHPFRSYYTDYLERREAENKDRAGEHYGSYSTDVDLGQAAAVDKEPTSTYMRERIDFPMSTQAFMSVYAVGWMSVAADWELFICSSEEQRQEARDRGGLFLFYGDRLPVTFDQSEHGGEEPDS